jgi:hypothetical protein
MPFALPHTQLPPTRSDFSKASASKPCSRRALRAAMPDDPAPITPTFGSEVISATLVRW